MSKAAGVHVSHTNRTGFGDYLRIPAEAGNPIPLIYGLNQNLAADVQQHSPVTKLIYRDTRFGADPFNDAFFLMTEAQAEAAGRAWVSRYAPVWSLNPANWYAFCNEPGVHTAQAYKLYAAFNIGAMQKANEIGVRLALYGWSTGAPDLTLVQHLIPSLIMAKAGGHILSLHEYSLEGPMITTPPNPLILRYRQLRALLPANAQCDFALTEIGPGAGWGTPYTGQAYVNVIAAYDSEIMKDAYVIGGCLFDVGNSESNLSQDFRLLAAYAAATPTPPPTPPPPPPPPPAGECRGAPRVQFARKVVLLPQGVAYGADWYAAVGPFGYDVSKSADSAGIGDLDSRSVIAVNPGEWGGDLAAWFAAHYPGVQLQMINAATPQKLKNFLAAGVPAEEPPAQLDVPYLNQLDGADADYARGDCGPACVAMALNFHGQTVTVDQVSQATGLPAGFLFTSWQTLNTAARAFGYSVVSSLGNTFDDIRSEIDAGRPVMALINYAKLPAISKYDPAYARGHFLLIIGYDDQGVVYHDPYWHGTDGASRRLSWGEFDAAWATPNQDFTYLRQLGEIAPYAPPPPPPPVVRAWVGLHLRADPLDHNSPQYLHDLAVVNTARIEAVKIKTSDTLESLTGLIAAGLDPAKIVLRLFAAGDNPSLKSAALFYNEQKTWLAYFASRGGRYVEVHNEPNLTLEGMGAAWSTPAQFADFYRQVKSLIRSNHPGLLVGFPGLSPQDTGSAITLGYTVANWLTACDGEIRDSDWIGAHSYWTSAGQLNDPSHGAYWKKFIPFGKPILITEFANVGLDSPAAKGDQYVAYYAGLTAPVLGAYAYVSSASDPAFVEQIWRSESGAMNDIPRRVGARR